jgi:DNA-binding NarL/FixJ family response regulator
VTTFRPSLATRFLLIDDHPLLREGVALTLGRIAAEAEVAEVDSCEAGLAFLAELEQRGGVMNELDLIVLDLALPGLSGLAAIDATLAAAQGVPIVILAGRATPGLVQDALKRGVRGFLSKSLSGPQLMKALELVFSGGCSVSPEWFGGVEMGASLVLTPRQKRVMRMLLDGQATRTIAESLGIADVTVRVHVQAVLKAVGVKSREELLLSSRAAELLRSS